MVSDPTSQNALSTLLGAFVFFVVGIVGPDTSADGHNGRIILCAATVAIVLLVVGTLPRWIGHITAFGRMAYVIDRVEEAATKAMTGYAAYPYPGRRPAVAVPENAIALVAPQTGYIAHIDVTVLGKIAERHGLTIHVDVLPGAMMHPLRRPVIGALIRKDVSRGYPPVTFALPDTTSGRTR